ncbi:ABC transporter permease [Rossellomorea marisflavi]|uniref:ABC transporter permease n=1 Tax=Rossellomorea marisflavi TaxID=189381 RepID=UPI003D2D4A31
MAWPIFWHRFKDEWMQKWKVVRSVIDWTIALYLVIPFSIMVPFFYRDWWNETESYWATGIPIWILLSILGIMTLGGNIRTYVLEADLLFLIEKKERFVPMKRLGFMVTMGQSLMSLVLPGALALPIFLNIYNERPFTLAVIFILLFSLKWSVLLIKKYIAGKWKKGIYILLMLAAFVLITTGRDSPLLAAMASLILFIILVVYFFKGVKGTADFQNEVEIEQSERNQYVNLVYSLSSQIEKEKGGNRGRPFILFRNSRRIFKERTAENGILELSLKAFLRNGTYLRTYIQMISITSAGILFLPLVLKWLLFGGILIFMTFWVQTIFKKLTSNRFFEVAPFDKEAEYAAANRFGKWLGTPVLIWTGTITICSTIWSVYF